MLLLAGGVGAFVTLGKAEPKMVPTPGTDVASRLARLPEATVDSVRLLADYSDTLDIAV